MKKIILNFTLSFVTVMFPFLVNGNNITTEKINQTTALADGDIYFHNAIAFCKYNLSSDVYCQESEGFLDEALKYFLVAYETNKEDASLNFKIGICYFFNNGADKSVSYFEKAIALNPNIDPQIEYYLALSKKYSSQWNSAIEYFRLFADKCKKGSLPETAKIKEDILQKHIVECKRADSLSKKSSSVIIKNLGSAINSQYRDYSSVISESGNSMLYTSRRPDYRLMPTEADSIEFESDVDNYFDNIYVSYFNDNNWVQNKRLGDMLTVIGEHYAILDISKSGDRCLLYKSDKSGDIFEGVFENGDWKGMTKIEGVNSDKSEPTACYAPDMQSIYLISTREGGFGGKDIFIAKKISDTKYESPVNIGNILNTATDEDGLFFSNDSTLYFASEGHVGIGGFDIFKSTKRNNIWSKPELLPYPINTPYDDLFYCQSGDGTKTFLTSNRHGSYGKLDIFSVSTKQEEISDNAIKTQDSEIKPTNGAISVKGKVVDFKNNSGVKSKITVKNIDGSIVYRFFTNNDGSYEYFIDKKKPYCIEISATNYDSYSDTLQFDIIPSELLFTNKLFPQSDSKLVSVKNSSSNNVTGVVVDYATKQPISKGTIIVIDSTTGAKVTECDIKDGRYACKLDAQKKYIITSNTQGYISQTQHVKIENEPVFLTEYVFKTEDIAQIKTPISNRLVVFTGIVSDFSSKTPLAAKIEFLTAKTDSLITSVNSDANGLYSIVLPGNLYYKVRVNANGHLRQIGFVNSNMTTDVVFSNLKILNLADGFLKNNVNELLITQSMFENSAITVTANDSHSNSPVKANISLSDTETQTKSNSYSSTAIPFVASNIQTISISNESYASYTDTLVSQAAIGEFTLNTTLSPGQAMSYKMRLPDFLFNSAKYDTKSELAADLADFAKAYASDTHVVVKLSGHADSKGTAKGNLRLSEKRAASIAKILKKNGIAESQIVIEALGDTKPVASNDTEEGKALNRRVEFTIEYVK